MYSEGLASNPSYSALALASFELLIMLRFASGIGLTAVDDPSDPQSTFAEHDDCKQCHVFRQCIV